MKKLLLLCAALLFSAVVSAQEFVVKSFEAKVTDLTAKINPVEDLNGNPCALIRVQIACRGCLFEGNIVGTPEARAGEYLVYVPAGTRRLKISHPDFLPLTYEFNLRIEKNCTYELRLTLPQNTTAIPELNTQFLVMKVSPQNAMVFIDDQVQTVAADGTLSRELPFGEHTYRVESPMHHPRRGTFAIAESGRTELSVSLDAAYGFLSVTSAPESGARVVVDGKEVGTTPYKSDRMARGSYQVQVVKPGYYPQMQPVTVTDNRTATLAFALKANFAQITLQAANPAAEIWVSGKRCGTGSWTGRLDAGTYSVESRCEGYEKALQSVVVEAGVPQTVRLGAQTPIYGILKVNSSPLGATVRLDGEVIGDTPLISNRVLVGPHRVEISKEGSVPYSRDVVVAKGQTADVMATLKPVAKEGSSISGSTPAVSAGGTSTSAPYKVGDYYNENGKKGIVFEVDASGQTGKIMALNDLSGKFKWGKEGETRAFNKADGMQNQRIIERIAGWQAKYPAFAGCAALGEGWYLPAKDELKRIYDNRKLLSSSAEQHGGTALTNGFYWSSSEGSSANAWGVFFGSGNFGNGNKSSQYRVRPVAVFGGSDAGAGIETSANSSGYSSGYSSGSGSTSYGTKKTDESVKTSTSTRYKVGDYYNENGKKGIVFEVDATGNHGKIMALKDLPGALSWGPNHIETGANHKTDGSNNLSIIQQVPDWWHKHAAFARCVALGSGWYLPAIDELKIIYKNRELLSARAIQHGGSGFENNWYMSSSESKESDAKGIYFSIGKIGNHNGKYRGGIVRPISKF